LALFSKVCEHQKSPLSVEVLAWVQVEPVEAVQHLLVLGKELKFVSHPEVLAVIA
jgi:hypothetical protein